MYALQVILVLAKVCSYYEPLTILLFLPAEITRVHGIKLSLGVVPRWDLEACEASIFSECLAPNQFGNEFSNRWPS